MSTIIKNEIKFLGDTDEIKSVIKSLESEKSSVDFNNIIPIEKIGEDYKMDDYMNTCINLYMIEENIPDDDKDFVESMKFIGNSMEVPYTFKILKLSNIIYYARKNKYDYYQMINDADNFMDKVKNKAIFNNYVIRDTFWGTGSGAKNPSINDQVIEFETLDKPAIKVFSALSKMYPNIVISYKYIYDGIKNDILIEDGNIKVISGLGYKDKSACDLIKENCKL